MEIKLIKLPQLPLIVDYYLEDRARLEGQPKRAIADYVEQNGIMVPRRFGSLQEARASGKEVLLRSEHQQDSSMLLNVVSDGKRALVKRLV